MWRLVAGGASPSSAGSLHGGFVLSGIGDGKGRGPTCWRNDWLLLITINKNKPKPPRRGKTDWLASRQGRTGQDRAGQGWTGQDKAGHRRHLTLGNEPTRNCKHKEIIKGANEEGNAQSANHLIQFGTSERRARII